MDYYYSVNAADLTPLKTELVDVVSSCLMKEPPYEAVRPDQLFLYRSNRMGGTHQRQKEDKPAVSDGVMMVAHMRELVHLISRQDGEFVLKLALYTRRTLHLRSSPNYLVALCAREPNCIPFLQPYMDKIVMIPSDWLSIANFAYFYDCDAAHDFSGCLVPYADEGDEEEEITVSHTSGGLVRPSATATHKMASRKSSPAARTVSSSPSREVRGAGRSEQNKLKKTKKTRGSKAMDPTRSYLPAALRTSLVHCFTKFTPFSMSKYDNEAAEHRAHRKARKLLQKHQQEHQVSKEDSDPSGDETEDDTDSSNISGGNDEAENERTGAQTTDTPWRHRKSTFTYKLLIRMLHITQPSFLVCCLLGKRYPQNEDAFMQMGLHLTDPTWKPAAELTFKAVSLKSKKGSTGVTTKKQTTKSDVARDTEGNMQPYCVFNPSLSGTRMRLPVAQTWETLLSKEGNIGKVWDFLIASRAVGYMALLRNVRNILTRTCCAATHKLVLEKLVDEQQVAMSQQLPYRFYSAFLAVKEVREMAILLAYSLPASETKSQPSGRRGRGSRGTRGCGSRRGRGGRGAAVAINFDERVQHAHASFENPAASLKFIHRYLDLYTAAIDSAINTSARLNVIPMKGTSIVILCVTQALLEPMAATGAAAETASIQRKIDVAALLIAMMMRSCEHCVVLLYCYDEYVVFREEDYADVTTEANLGVTANAIEEIAEHNERSSSSSIDEEPYGSDNELHSGSNHESRSSDSSDADPFEYTRSPHTPHRPSFMKLVTALVSASTHLLSLKMYSEIKQTNKYVTTSFDMFAEGSGAQFPYEFLDEVIERSMRVESLLVFDEGVHRTYAHMNRNAPAFGDLPTYLSRLRRTCSPELVYVGVNLKAASPPSSQSALSAAKVALQQVAAKDRFHHHNDLLLTGFSDAIVRLVAERMGGGPLSVIERAAETFQVARFSARASHEALAERAKVLKIVSAIFEDRHESSVAASTATVKKKDDVASGLGSPSAALSPNPQPNTMADDSVEKTGEMESPPSRPFSSSRKDSAFFFMDAPAVTLPYFDAQGRVVTSVSLEMDWSNRTRRSEWQLQQLTGSSSGRSSSPVPIASSSSVDALATSGAAALPSIRRLFSKRSSVDIAESKALSGSGASFLSPEYAFCRAHQYASHATKDGGEVVADAEEAAWLSPQNKHVSPICHPQPFISLVKLISASATASKSTATSSTAEGKGHMAAAKPKKGRQDHVPSRVPSRATTPPPSCATTTTAISKVGARHDQQVRNVYSPLSPTSTLSPPPTRCKKTNKVRAVAAGSSFGVVRRLLTSYRVCRFFISSTFLDMNNERNAITLDIFPRLRRWAAEAGLKVTLLEVDLRWGIPAVATRCNLSTSVCLNEVSRCSPFFIGMIGARYGSCPPTPLQLVVDEDVEAADYDWMTELTNPHVSVTELEMRHAMYNTRRRLGRDDAPTALFFARDYDYLISTFGAADAAARRVYEGDSPTAAQSIALLKKRIADDGFKLITYKAKYSQSSKNNLIGHRAAAASPSNGGDNDVGDVTGVKSDSNGSGGINMTHQSSMRAMLEDDLGRWAVRGGRALDAVGPTIHTKKRNSNDKGADSLWSFVKNRIDETEEPENLTSMTVPLDMGDFSITVFAALQQVIRQICGVRMNGSDGEADAAVVTENGATAKLNENEVKQSNVHGAPFKEPSNPAAAVDVASPTSPTVVSGADLYESLIVAQSKYARKLSALYAAPRGLLGQLASFAVAGMLNDSSRSTLTSSAPSTDTAGHSSAGKGGKAMRNCSTSQSTQTRERRSAISVHGVGSHSMSPQDNSSHRQRSNTSNSRQRSGGPRKANVGWVSSTSSILLLEGYDGDGKSSTLAALVERILQPMHSAASIPEARSFLFYSTQAGDDSVRSLLLFLVTSYRAVFHLYAEMSVQESDSVEQLLLMLNHAYAVIHRRYETLDTDKMENFMTAPAVLVVVLDGLDKSSESAELVSLLGTILHPLAVPHIRFIVSACPRSPLANALRTRTPAARVVMLPLLDELERAQLVRLHLAAYGKFLEESFSADELKELLRKAGAGRPSHLISAITYLRLFSTFATLREDIRSLPATSTQLYVKFFYQLQSRFDGPTCRLVLTLLLLRQPVGGVMEYNLYRLVSNVAVASRLVALLRGICVDSHHGRLFITSTAFATAVAHTYLPYSSDYQAAQERVLVAELRYQPVDMTTDEQEVRQVLRHTRESIERNAEDPLAPCLFNPERYSPQELLGVLQGSVQASRLDVISTLVCYLPFLECLIVNRRMLSQLIGLLSLIMHATKRSSDFAPALSSAGYGDPYDEADLSSNADVLQCESSLFANGVLPLQWRQYRNEVRRISNVLGFLQTHHHILLRQPSLLRQCVWNALVRNSCISAYDTASTAQLRRTVHQMSFPSLASKANEKSEEPRCGTEASSTNTESNEAASAALSALWVHWLNLRQHGGETRLLLTTASPQAIRCMAISPDETEVALGSDDGFVRRVGATEGEDAPPSSPQDHPEKSSCGGGGNRLVSMLRHESAVAAVRYVPQHANGRSTSSFARHGASEPGGAGSFSTPMSQLLVSGCVRGIVYVWNLEDNSLLQRGIGHLRSISDLVCHPLEPTILCSCSHDSYVMLWNLCGLRSQLSDEITSAIALRLPKYPANSPERQQQQRMLSGGRGGGRGGRGGDRGSEAVYETSLAARSTAVRPEYLIPLIAFHTERQHRTPVSCIDFHRTGDIMASGSWDGALLLYNTRELCTPPPTLPYDLLPPKRSPSFPVVEAEITTVKKLQKWRPHHGAEYRKVIFRAVEFNLGSPVRSLSFSKSLAVTCIVGCHNGAVFVIDYASSAIVGRWTSLHTAPITRVLTSPDGRCVASADEHGVVRLTYMGISGTVFATFNGHQGAVTGLSFRAQFESATEMLQKPQLTLLTAGEDRTLQAWGVNSSNGPEAKSSTLCLTTSHSTAVTAVATSADGLKLVTGSADGTAIVFCVPEESAISEGWASDFYDAAATATTGNDAAVTDRFRTFSEHRIGAALWKSNSFFTTSTTSAVQEHRSATRPMAPSFVLRHDDCRITCIKFALQDTKIVVGVVFGLVYVWSSAPGLNPIEGRLLLRVRVPEQGLYPVVSLDIQESVAAAAASSSASPNLTRAASVSISEPRYTMESDSGSTRALHLSSTASALFDTVDDDNSAHVTAVCANGDVAVLKVLNETASRVMVADQERRRHLRRLRQLRRRRSTAQRAASFSNNIGGLPEFNASLGMSSSSVFGVAGASRAKDESVPLCSPNGDMRSQTMHYPIFNPPTASAPTPKAPMARILRTMNWQPKEKNPPSKLPTVRNTIAPPVPSPDTHIFSKRQLEHSSLLDRRAKKLQRLLKRCHAMEVELRESFLLDLYRHRLEWANAADAAEIIAVVWLCGRAGQASAQGQQHALDGADGKADEARGGGSSGKSPRHKLALVVTQRKLFLLLSNRHESAVSGGLNIHMATQTSDAAVVLDNGDPMPEDGTTATRACVADNEDKNETLNADAHAQQETKSKINAEVIHNFLREAVVDVEYLLSEEEYFTAASAAVPLATTTSTTAMEPEHNTEALATSTAHIETTKEAQNAEAGPTNAKEKLEAVAPLVPLANTFLVGVTTSRGEVLLLRIEVPHLHQQDGHLRTSPPPRNWPARFKEESDVIGGMAVFQLRERVLPSTQVHLCRRLSFTRTSFSAAVGAGVDLATAAGTAAKEGGERAVRLATTQRTAALPLVTAVQLSVLPGMFADFSSHHLQHSYAHEKDTPSSSLQTVEQVILVAGSTDGSTRVWIVPASPLADRDCYRRGAPTPTSADVFIAGQSTAASPSFDVPVGCFFCSSAVHVVSPLLQVSAAPPGNKSAKRRAVKSSPLPRWVVGDTLGNVYQLQLECDAPGGVASMLRFYSKSLHFGRTRTGFSTSPFVDAAQMNEDGRRLLLLKEIMAAGGVDARPWASSLQKLIGMMERPPTTEVPQTLKTFSPSTQNMNNDITSSGCNGNMGGAGSRDEAAWAMGASQAPADWLASVDFSTPARATLLKRSSATLSPASSPVEVVHKRDDGASSTPHSAHDGADTLPSFSSCKNPPQSSLPPQDWLILPDLPARLRTASLHPSLPFKELMSGHSLHTTEDTTSSVCVNSLRWDGISASSVVLPSFGASQQQQHSSSSARQVSKEKVELAFNLNFETPLSDLLSAYRRNAQEDEKSWKTEDEMMQHSIMRRERSAFGCWQNPHATTSTPPQPSTSSFLAAHVVTQAAGTNATKPSEVNYVTRGAASNAIPSVRFELPSSPTPFPVSSSATRNDAASAVYKDPTAQLFMVAQNVKGSNEQRNEENEEIEDDYFGILYKSGPPPLSSGSLNTAEMKRAWFLQQQQVLKEATRVQRYNKEARAALKAYQQRIASAMGM